jgi:hypothetical protein
MRFTKGNYAYIVAHIPDIYDGCSEGIGDTPQQVIAQGLVLCTTCQLVGEYGQKNDQIEII